MKLLIFIALSLHLLSASSVQAAPLKALLCTGDYGMWAQDRVPLISGAVEKAFPGAVEWESEQSYNFVKKLEARGWAERFDVIACGDIALGQMTTRAQQSLVRFVNGGGGLIYVMWSKSNEPFRGSRTAVPMPLESILPFRFPFDFKPKTSPYHPTQNVRDDAVALGIDTPFFKGLDFSTTPFIADRKADELGKLPPFLLERAQGKGRVMVLYGAFGATYKRTGHATREKQSGGWDEWPQLGQLWQRLLARAGQNSPILNRTRAQVDGAVTQAPLKATIEVDANIQIDDIRAANFSIVALQQLYNEDSARGEELFLDLNPRDWFDRRTQEVLGNVKGRFPDKTQLFRQYNIKGIIMGANSYGSYKNWSDAKYQSEIAKHIAQSEKYPDILKYFQPGNEPPLNDDYFKFHNRFAGTIIAGAPRLQIIGPNAAFNISGVNEERMKQFIAQCGANTDVLNWHHYGEPPSSVLAEARYWSEQATGKLRGRGTARVMFTESDAWNTRDSQFNYLMTRAFTFLPEARIIANFQYCMRPRSEGGPYRFGVLQPDGEMSANYNGYWIWRDLRGRMTQTKITTPNDAARDNLHALSSSADGGKTVSTVLYYDTGFFDGTARKRAERADVTLRVKLPPGRYKLQRSQADWDTRQVVDVPETVSGTAIVTLSLSPYEAAALTWRRQ